MPGAKTEAGDYQDYAGTGSKKAKTAKTTAHPVCLYALLGVARGASAVELRKAYHVLARKTHPDKCPGDPDAVANFQALGRAYAILKDEGKRKRYDATGVDDDESEGFWSAYERYRGVQVSAADIDGFLASYRGGAEEEDDLMNALLVSGGDATRLLAEVMGSRDEDVPRYLAFFDAVLGGAPWGGAGGDGGGDGGGGGGGGGAGASQGQKVLKKAQAKKLKKALAASHVMTLAELEAEAEAEGESVGGSDGEGGDDGEDDGEDEEGGAEMDDFIAPEGSESEAAAEEEEEEEEEEPAPAPAPAPAPPKRTQPKKAKKKQKPATGGSGGDMPASLLAMFAAKDASRQSGLDDFEARWAGGGDGGGSGSKKASKKRKK